MRPARPWHALTADDVCRSLETSDAGLTRTQADERLATYGPNQLRASRHISGWTILFGQFKSILIIILLVAAVLSAFLGSTLEAIAIGVIVVFAALLGFVQEYRAERAIESLHRMAAPTANVIRDGEWREVPAHELVPGDIVSLRDGDRIPADLRLLEAVNLQADEASLTGESTPVAKSVTPLEREDVPLGDRVSMAYAGTIATYGRGRGVAVATGMATEFGKIARMLEEVDAGTTPLQRNLDKIGRTLGWIAAVVVVAIVLAGLARGQSFIEMFVFGIALAVAVVPEALPAVVTISLAIGVQRMVRRNALVRRLPAVETLGCTSVICSDKTGTMTKDEMTVRKIWAADRVFEVEGAGYAPEGGFLCEGASVEPNDPALVALLRAGVLASDATVAFSETESRWLVKGDPTEAALIVAGAKAGLDAAALRTQCPRVDEVPFSSEAKRMTTLHDQSDGRTAYAKGAPETLLLSCARWLGADGERELDEGYRDELVAVARTLAGEGLRVLALATKRTDDIATAERDLTFLGLVGMSDPPRPEVRRAIAACREAGVKPVMITGDHPLTAEAIARELGLSSGGSLLTGTDLDAMDAGRLERAAEETDVYARVSPEHKLRVVTALQSRGHIVAMTGDGVNDAPALKKADIGIAMGISGTDVTKDAAAVTLTDDNFASIVAAVEEGRGIFENIKKYLMYLLSSNIGEIVLVAAAVFAGLPLPLSAVQILYVNLATDGLPALALAVDPADPDLMRRPPRRSEVSVFTRAVILLMLAGGLWSGAVNLGLFWLLLTEGRTLADAMTMTFVSLVLIQFFKAYNFRSDRRSVFVAPFANRWLNLAVVWELALLLVIIYVPFLQKAFGTRAMDAGDWLLVVAVAATVIPVIELVKFLENRFDESPGAGEGLPSAGTPIAGRAG